MTYTDRLLQKRLADLFAHFSAVAVVGARQVGKTTLLAHCFPTAKLITFDPLVDVMGAREDADFFLANQPEPLILDEIQYVPQLTAALKRRIDAGRRPGRFLLTGSQQWQVIRNLADSMAGRIAILELDGFSLAEIAGHAEPWLPLWLDRTLELSRARRPAAPVQPLEQVWRGWLPQAQQLPPGLLGDFFDSYIQTYIERDARLAGDVSDWRLFYRFFRLAMALSGGEIVPTQLGRELGMHPDSARHWIAMLEATFQWREIPPWHGNTLKRISKRSKGYGADTGLVCRALAIPDPDSLVAHPRFGAIFETAVVNELRKQAAIMPAKPAFYHWRSHAGMEVDVILEYAGRLFPLEITASSHPDSAKAAGIRSFMDTYPNQSADIGLIVAPAGQPYALNENTWVMPWDATIESARPR